MVANRPMSYFEIGITAIRQQELVRKMRRLQPSRCSWKLPDSLTAAGFREPGLGELFVQCD